MVNGYWYKYVYVYIKYVKKYLFFENIMELWWLLVGILLCDYSFLDNNLEICFIIEYYDCVIYVFYFIKLVFGSLGFIVMIIKYMYFEKKLLFLNIIYLYKWV